MSVLRQKDFTAKNGFAFRVIVDDRDGVINTPTSVEPPHMGNITVAFWDVTANVCAATYYLDSLLRRHRGSSKGFSLHTNAPEWTIDPETMSLVDKLLEGVTT